MSSIVKGTTGNNTNVGGVVWLEPFHLIMHCRNVMMYTLHNVQCIPSCKTLETEIILKTQVGSSWPTKLPLRLALKKNRSGSAH